MTIKMCDHDENSKRIHYFLAEKERAPFDIL